MRKSLLLLAFLAIAQLTYSQTTCDGLWFSTQEEVDQFAIDNPDCTSVDGMVIEFSGLSGQIYDLSPLSNITTIQGNLQIFGSAALGEFLSTEGLGNLTSVGGLYLENVNDPDGFINLTNVTGTLSIMNEYVEGFEGLSLAGFNNLQSAGSINLTINNPDGNYINVFPNLVSLDNLHIGGMWGPGNIQVHMDINTLNGFNALTELGSLTMGIGNTSTLEQIDNLEILNSVVSMSTLNLDFLVASSWNSLVSLETLDDLYIFSEVAGGIDFPYLSSVGNFFVRIDGFLMRQDYSFPVLTTVDSLVVLEEGLTPTANLYALSLPALLAVTTHFEITGDQNSPSGVNYFPAPDYDFGLLTVLPDLVLTGTNIQTLEMFESLISILGPVEIQFNHNLSMCSIYAVCEKISSSVDPNEITIMSNNVGCSSIVEVNAACSGNYITGTVYADVDCNQTLDANDIPIDFAMLSDESEVIVASSSSNGDYVLAYDPGANVELQVNRLAFLPTGLLNITPSEPYGLITNDIFVCPDYAYHNVSILCNAMSPARPGFAVFYDITITNHSANIETLSTTIDLSDLPNYTLVECDGCQENGTYLEYADQELYAFESIQLTLVLQVPQNVAIGSEWDISGYITGSADNQNNVDDNAFDHHQLVVASYDPNDIAVDRSAINFENYNTNGEWLNYQIRFQNTGNYPAEFISVLNGLDDELDMNTLQIIETSHDAQLFFNENRELEFYFENIQLPDSTSDPEGSNGFIRYRIKTNEGLNLSSFIESTAAIYFDYNEPVITNTATTEFYVCPASLHPSGGIDICYDTEITLEADASWETYQWSVNGNALGTSSTQSFEGLNEGPNGVVITAETEFCENSVEYEIFVMDEVEMPVIMMEWDEISVTIGGIIEWYLNGELIASEINTLVIEEPGDYTAVRTIGDCSSTSAVFTVTDVPQCEAPVVAPYANSICSGESIEFMASGDYDTFEWSLDGSQVGQGNSHSQVLNDSGTQLFELLAESAYCTWTLQLAVMVTPTPAVPVIAQNGSTLVVTDDGGMMDWYLNGELIASNATALIVEEVGDYTAVRTIGDCSSTSAVFTVTDVPQCEAPVVAPYANSICSGESIEFMASGDYDTFEWSLDGSQVGQGNSHSQVLNDSGTQLFELLAESAYCTWTLQLAVMVTPTPAVPVIAQNGSTLVVTDDGGMMDWYLNGELIASNATALIVEEVGDYTAVRTIGDCSSTSAVFTVTDVPQCEAPVVADYPSNICSGEIIELSASGAYDNYTWSLEGNPVGQGNSLSQVMPSSGTHFFELSAESPYCTWTLQVPVIVNPTPALPVITQNGQMLEVTGNGGLFEWFLNGSFIGSNGNTLEIDEGGDYVVVRIIGSCSSTSNTFTVDDQSLCEEPELLPYPASICAGESIELAVLGEYDSFLWYNGLEEVGQGENISTVMMNEGNYAFSLLALNPTCSWTLEFAVQVNDVPDIPLITQDAWTLATDAEGDLSWSYDGAIIGTGTSVEITWIGEYALTATADGCASSTASVAITLCGFDESELISGPSTICQNLSANIQIADLFEGYQVLQQGAWVETGTIYELPSANLGIGVIEFQIVAQGCIQNIEHNFYVLAIPSAPSVIQSGNTLTASGTGSYAWTLDGNPLATTSSTLEMTQSGAYGVAVSLAGCMSEWTEGFYTYTSVEELENNNVVVYPNPAMDKLQIAANRLSATDVLVLINVEGQIIELNKSETNIDVSPLARGLYLLQSRDATGRINWQERLILQ